MENENAVFENAIITLYAGRCSGYEQITNVPQRNNIRFSRHETQTPKYTGETTGGNDR